MPIYEYTCLKCNTAFETLVPNASTPVACEHCGSSRIEKKFSVFSTGMASGAPAACGKGGCPAAESHPTACTGGQCPYS